MRRSVTVLALVIGGLTAVWGALVLLDLLARAERVSSQPLDVRGGLVLETTSGDLEVVARPGPARLELRSVRGLFGGPGTRVERADGRLEVRTNCTGPFSVSCSGSLRVLVPPGTRVALGTGSGEIVVRGVQDGVTAETGSGDIRLEDVSGSEVSADTGSGEVQGTGVAADRVRTETGSGDVRMLLGRAPRDVFVDTGSGEVDLRLPDVGYRVATDTGSGDEQVGVRQDPGAGRSLRVETGSGDVRIRPPG